MRCWADSGSTATLRSIPAEPPPPIGVRLSSHSEAGMRTRMATNHNSAVTALDVMGDSTPAEPAHALARRDDVGQADAEFVVDDHDFALRDEIAVDQHIHRFACHGLELDH